MTSIACVHTKTSHVYFIVYTTLHQTTHTTATSASHVVNSPGTSRCIVVAYNGALEPSAPVCSDGVTVDVTPPEISAVSIKVFRLVFA